MFCPPRGRRSRDVNRGRSVMSHIPGPRGRSTRRRYPTDYQINVNWLGILMEFN